MGMSKSKLAAAEREMQKTRIIFKKNAGIIKQSKSLARKIATLSPENMAIAIFSFFVMSASGIHKKGLRHMLESEYPPEVLDGVEPILCELEQLIEVGDPMMLEFTEAFQPSGLTVAQLVSEAKMVKNGLTKKQIAINRFYKFYNAFLEKVSSLGYSKDDQTLLAFMDDMTDAVGRIKIKGAGKGNG